MGPNIGLFCISPQHSQMGNPESVALIKIRGRWTVSVYVAILTVFRNGKHNEYFSEPALGRLISQFCSTPDIRSIQHLEYVPFIVIDS